VRTSAKGLVVLSGESSYHPFNFVRDDVCLSLTDCPTEVSLAIPLSGCGNRCPGCHSPHLQDQHYGEPLTIEILENLITKYQFKISCVIFMGGPKATDIQSETIETYLNYFDVAHKAGFKVCWYTAMGFDEVPVLLKTHPYCPDYLKTGKYIEALGGLSSPTTNQRFFHLRGMGFDSGSYVYVDATYLFHRTFTPSLSFASFHNLTR
jgi:anaerobic ribonucleoside-triphosphate reductase activating protein